MTWKVHTTNRFDRWFDALPDSVRASVIAGMLVLEREGPLLGRPYADTVKGSVHPNTKELRIQSAGSPVRIFFAFDPHRVAILLCAGAKRGREKRFYREMLRTADNEFSAHLSQLQEGD